MILSARCAHGCLRLRSINVATGAASGRCGASSLWGEHLVPKPTAWPMTGSRSMTPHLIGKSLSASHRRSPFFHRTSAKPLSSEPSKVLASQKRPIFWVSARKASRRGYIVLGQSSKRRREEVCLRLKGIVGPLRNRVYMLFSERSHDASGDRNRTRAGAYFHTQIRRQSSKGRSCLKR